MHRYYYTESLHEVIRYVYISGTYTSITVNATSQMQVCCVYDSVLESSVSPCGSN